ncbi:NADH dehydrogenase [ubiquinone] 1 beta subcomplex subunit 2, mitochondrial [Lepeophtheirus salmonis]|uniref:NADH dehydrogenase 1 beta subcomplex subunit 2, mitochondrial n=2 Tax=Lepeophtheirus salmonis TaxID=72036 RepID=C1BUJ8_LEPSM|nr:NADH dehydrogenase [ubiquinone] 1 beta subcomplex subunit 2, mitochondrial-like isoform X1 [Lepeophtheirus salmonis]ACO12701.1 NADH dehydrogenase 1 beta subcomplex subunit 2, mitochondrial precursor [Lepeophtheirus salmonis]
MATFQSTLRILPLIASRCSSTLVNRSQGFATSAVKNGGQIFLYRKGFPPLRESDRKIMIAFNGFLWWWVFFNLFTDPWTALGHSPSIKPEKFTNEELGIPPDVE